MTLKVLNILGIKENEMVIITIIIAIQVYALKIHFNYS